MMTFWDLFRDQQQETEIKPWQLQIKDLTGKVLFVSTRTDLDNVDLSAAGPLIGADFQRVDAIQANFENLDCRGSRFVRANLRRANFRGADLSLCDFRGADVSHCDFSGACILYTRGFGENEKRGERARMDDETKGLDPFTLAVLENVHDETFDHVRIQNFRDRRRYYFHLKAALSVERAELEAVSNEQIRSLIESWYGETKNKPQQQNSDLPDELALSFEKGILNPHSIRVRARAAASCSQVSTKGGASSNEVGKP